MHCGGPDAADADNKWSQQRWLRERGMKGCLSQRSLLEKHSTCHSGLASGVSYNASRGSFVQRFIDTISPSKRYHQHWAIWYHDCRDTNNRRRGEGGREGAVMWSCLWYDAVLMFHEQAVDTHSNQQAYKVFSLSLSLSLSPSPGLHPSLSLSTGNVLSWTSWQWDNLTTIIGPTKAGYGTCMSQIGDNTCHIYICLQQPAELE